MLDFDAHSRFADATAELMRSCALVAAQTMTVSACRGLTLWSDMLRPPGERATSRLSSGTANPFEAFWRFSPVAWMPRAGSWPQSHWLPTPYGAWGQSPLMAWPVLSDWSSWSRLYWPAWSGQAVHAGPFALPEAMTQTALRTASQTAYASYRSAGGHAVAQVIMPGAETVVAGLTATAVFTQMQTMLGMWRAALGA